MRSSQFSRGLTLFVLATSAALSFASCSSNAPQDPSYVRVELVPALTAAKVPRAVRVVIMNEATSALVASLCVNIEGDQGTATASFVLRRDPGRPPTERIAVEVTPFDSIAGQETVAPGKEFACPSTLPPALAESRKISIDFCETETRTLVFHVGAVCCDGSGGSGGGGSGGASSGGGGAGGGAGGGGSGGAGGGGSGGAGGGGSGGTSGGDSGGAGGGGSGGTGGGGNGSCTCMPGFVCGVGLTSSAKACGPSECCSESISSACALDI